MVYAALVFSRCLIRFSMIDMDVIFALAYNEGVSPVAVSLRRDIPPAGSPEADRILGIQSSAVTSGRDSGEES